MKIVFMGTPDFSVPSLNSLINAGHEVVLCVTQPDRERGRGKKVSFSPVKECAISHNIPVLQPEKIKDPEAVDELRKYEADVFIVVAFGQILPKEVLEMPRFGCINVHASLLPKYRGAAPIQWAILNGDKETGITIMQMGEGLDDGDILSQRRVDIEKEETGGSLFDKLSVIGGELLTETLVKVFNGEIKPEKQDEERATKVTMIRKDMGHINFEDPAVKIERQVRGLYPWPSAYTKINGKGVKVFLSEALNENREGKEPGEVIKADRDGFLIQTGSGILSLKELQPEGKKRMNYSDFLNGNPVKTGTVL